MSNNSNNSNNKRSLLGWHCPTCTYYHRIAPAARCCMCGNLKVASRQQMHDFVLGKANFASNEQEGNVVELLNDDDDDETEQQAQEASSFSTTTASSNLNLKMPPPQNQNPNPNPNADSAWKHNLQNQNKAPNHHHFFTKQAPSSSTSTTGSRKRPLPSSTNNSNFSNSFFQPASSKPHPQQAPAPAKSTTTSTTTATTTTRPRNPYATVSTSTTSASAVDAWNNVPQHSNFVAPRNPPSSGVSTTTTTKKKNPPPNSNSNPTAVSTTNNNNIQKNPFTLASGAVKMTNQHHNPVPYTPGPVPLDVQQAQHWRYPVIQGYDIRDYQVEMSQTCLFHNTLVSLPTGLGKTMIAAVCLHNYVRWFAPHGKCIFLAPTLPLVEQQCKACFPLIGIPESETAVLTGRLSAASRKDVWNSARVIYCTPQTLQNDLTTGILSESAHQIVLVILDEAHKATGDHSYVQCLQFLLDASLQLSGRRPKFRIVGLSATPGSDRKAIQQVISNLHISKIEVRNEAQLQQYSFTRNIEEIVVEASTPQRQVVRRMSEQLIAPLLRELRQAGLWSDQYTGNDTLTYFIVNQAKKAAEQRVGKQRLGPYYQHFAALTTLVQIRSHAAQSLSIAKMDLLALQNNPQTARGMLRKIVQSQEFQELVNLLTSSVVDSSEASSASSSSLADVNPKLKKVQELLKEHFARKAAVGEHASHAIVFAEHRKTVSEIVSVLDTQRPHIRPRHFVGQSKSTTSSSTSTSSTLNGMNQAEQQQVIQEFQQGEYNVLVCTSIGEEGLDIGQVDLIINYDALKSPIRMIQRNGRTGRKRNGRIIVLMAEGPEAQKYRNGKQQEKTIYRALTRRGNFTFCPSEIPMFPPSMPLPERLDVTIPPPSAFHMSQVGGRMGSKRNKRKSSTGSTEMNSNKRWKISMEQEAVRHRILGPVVTPPPSEVKPQRGLSSALQKILLQGRQLKLSSSNQSESVSKTRRRQPSVGRSLLLLKSVEENHSERNDANTSSSKGAAAGIRRSISISRRSLSSGEVAALFPLHPVETSEDYKTDIAALQIQMTLVETTKRANENELSRPAPLAEHNFNPPSTAASFVATAAAVPQAAAVNPSSTSIDNHYHHPLVQEHAPPGITVTAPPPTSSSLPSSLAPVKLIQNPYQKKKNNNPMVMQSKQQAQVQPHSGFLQAQNSAEPSTIAGGTVLAPRNTDNDAETRNDVVAACTAAGATAETATMPSFAVANTSRSSTSALPPVDVPADPPVEQQQPQDDDQDFRLPTPVPSTDEESQQNDDAADEEEDDDEDETLVVLPPKDHPASVMLDPSAQAQDEASMPTTHQEQQPFVPPAGAKPQQQQVEPPPNKCDAMETPAESHPQSEVPEFRLPTQDSSSDEDDEEDDAKPLAALKSHSCSEDMPAVNGNDDVVGKPAAAATTLNEDESSDDDDEAPKPATTRRRNRPIALSEEEEQVEIPTQVLLATQQIAATPVDGNHAESKQPAGPGAHNGLLTDTPVSTRTTTGTLNDDRKLPAKSSPPQLNGLTDTPVMEQDLLLSPDSIVCSICFSGESPDEDPIVLCDGPHCHHYSGGGFHASCYNIPLDELKDDEPWYCDSCQHTDIASKQCQACHQSDGPLQLWNKKSNKEWWHPHCRFLSPYIQNDTPCSSCHKPGAVKCSDKACDVSIHPHCALTSNTEGRNWTMVHVATLDKACLACPKHVDLIDGFVNECMGDERTDDRIPKITLIQAPAKMVKPKHLQRQMPQPKQLTTKRPPPPLPRAPSVAKTIEAEISSSKEQRTARRKALLSSRFVDDQAGIDSDEDVDGDDEDEMALRRMQDEDRLLSQDSFINNNPHLTQASPDALQRLEDQHMHHHRALDAQERVEDQWKTPTLNRLRKISNGRGGVGWDEVPTPASAPSSQKGLGKMHFIRSVIDHHRQGGAAEDIEAFYHQVAQEQEGATDPSPEHVLNGTDHNRPPRRNDTWQDAIATNGKIVVQYAGSSSEDEDEKPQTKPAAPALTAEQRAKMEANRQRALQRRLDAAQKKQQQK